MRSNKITFDLTNENRIAVEELAQKYNKKYGPMLNCMINTIYYLPEGIREDLLDFITTKCHGLDEEIKIFDIYHEEELKEKQKDYLSIAKLLNHGSDLDFQPNYDDLTMKKYKMKDGILIVPRDWIIVNPELEGKCKFADVVECRNPKYGVPHFVAFKEYRKFDDEYIENVYKCCEKNWPGFEKLRKRGDEIELIKDPDKEGQYLNADEWNEAPIMGLFPIFRDDEECFRKNQPFGAMIKSISKKK